MGCGFWGLEYEVWDLGFGVWGLGFGVWGLGFGAEGVELGVKGSGVDLPPRHNPREMEHHLRVRCGVRGGWVYM